MTLWRKRLVLGVCAVAVLALGASALQSPPSHGLFCREFTRNGEGDWVAKRDVTIQGASGQVQFKTGIPLVDELQERLDFQCKPTRVVGVPA